MYVIKVTDIDELKIAEDLSAEKLQIRSRNMYANDASYNALKDAANVQDNRGLIY